MKKKHDRRKKKEDKKIRRIEEEKKCVFLSFKFKNFEAEAAPGGGRNGLRVMGGIGAIKKCRK